MAPRKMAPLFVESLANCSRVATSSDIAYRTANKTSCIPLLSLQKPYTGTPSL